MPIKLIIVNFTIAIMLVACSKWGKGNGFYFHVTGDMCQTLY